MCNEKYYASWFGGLIYFDAKLMEITGVKNTMAPLQRRNVFA